MISKVREDKDYSERFIYDIEGSDLGLYISKEIIELHHGEIIVVSQGRNKGSKFSIRLPL
ncbi:MAG: ATP-binding protein [Candidatus Thorarchaeota archaeon]